MSVGMRYTLICLALPSKRLDARFINDFCADSDAQKGDSGWRRDCMHAFS